MDGDSPGGRRLGSFILWLPFPAAHVLGQRGGRDGGGALLTIGGAGLLTRFLPAFGALAFLVPVWPFRQAQVAGPLQAVTARLTQAICEMLGMQVEREGHLLISNGVNVAVAEACNGMRLVFTLVLVIYAYAFMTPRRPYQRIGILLASPGVAIACNVIRLVPTVWVFGHTSAGFAETFHDVTGWVMLGVAFVLMGIARLLRWTATPDAPAMASSAAGALTGGAQWATKTAGKGTGGTHPEAATAGRTML